MARVATPAGLSPAPSSFRTDFYRQEFIKHRQCLAAQREYFSARAIDNADQALARVLNDLEQICAKDDADRLISGLLRQFNAVTGLSGWSDPARRH